MVVFTVTRFWNILLLILQGVFVIAGAFWWWNEYQASPQSVTIMRGQSDQTMIATVEGLRKEITALRADMSGLAARVSEIENRYVSSSISPNLAKQVPLPAVEPTEDELKQHQVERLAAIEKDFQSEMVEKEWASKTSSAIRDVFNAIGTQGNKWPELNGSSLQNVECRSSLCKLEVDHADQKAVMGFMRNFQGSIGRSLPRMVRELQQNPDGSFTTHAYMARPGRKF